MSGIVLLDPKYPHNVAQVIRAASCYGVPDVWMTGIRVRTEGDGKKYRLPREERMRGRYEVELRRTQRWYDDTITDGRVAVAVELNPSAEQLPYFEHPEDAVYVFGPEDGHVNRAARRLCSRFVQLPMLHCANLASAVYTVLYDRHCKRVLSGQEQPLVLGETGEFERV